MVYQSSNGYKIEKWNDRLFVLSRKGGCNSNPFYVDGDKAVFCDSLYVNDYTRKLCVRVAKLLEEAK